MTAGVIEESIGGILDHNLLPVTSGRDASPGGSNGYSLVCRMSLEFSVSCTFCTYAYTPQSFSSTVGLASLKVILSLGGTAYVSYGK